MFFFQFFQNSVMKYYIIMVYFYIFQVKRTLFSPMNSYPQKKVITFNKHTDDFLFNINYAELDHLPSQEVAYIGSLNLSQVILSGVSAVIAKHKDENVENKGIKAHFNMDDSGLLNLVNVEFVVEKIVVEEETDKDSTLSKLGSTISKLFGSDSESEKKPEGEDKPQDAADEKNNATKANETVTDKQNATDTDAKTKPKVVTIKEPIKTDLSFLTLQPLTPEQFKESKTKINELNEIDRKRNERESALNSLEAFVVDTQMKIDMEEYAECGTPEQIEEIRKECGKVSEWLYDEGYEAPTEMYQQKLKHLHEITNSIFYKHWEHRERPDVVAAMRTMLNNSKEFLKMAKNFTKDNPEKDVFTDVEVGVLEKKIDETETWLNKSIVEQDALKNNDEIKLTVESVREKMGGLDREVKYLINKMKIWRPKKPLKAKNDTEGQGKVEEIIPEQTSEAPETKKEETSEKPLQLEDENEHSEL